MTLLRNLPIRRKVTWVILLLSSFALLLVGGVLFGFQFYSFRQSFPRQVTSIGQIIASHSAGPLALKDPEGAASMLGALKASPQITEAQLRLRDGSLFVRYGRTLGWVPPAGEGIRFEGRHLIYSEPIIFDGEHIGTVHVRAAYEEELHRLLRIYGAVLSVALTLSFLFTAILSTRLQRVISDPILRLAATAKRVAGEKDYSVRAAKLGEDELGVFTDAFNDMLAQIQGREAELSKSRQKFETLVNSIEGVVWEADPRTLRYLYVSNQAERLLGYPTRAWLDLEQFWEQHLDAADRARAVENCRQAVAEKAACGDEYRMRAVDDSVVWVRSHSNVILEDNSPVLIRGVLFNVTKEKKAAEQLVALNEELLKTTRQAGMAEVATGVLHNVGNVLNSVNVSSTLVCERLRNSEIKTFGLLAALLHEHRDDLPGFLSRDEKGRAVPEFIQQLAGELEKERQSTLRELEGLAKNIEHIKQIVAMQQTYARTTGVMEILRPTELVEDALQMKTVALECRGVRLLRAFDPVPPVVADRHKVLQILVNLLRNAGFALDDSSAEPKQIVVSVARNGTGMVKVSVADNGVGISPENLTRIFSLGFTTRRDGHGFGLHTGALAAKEMGGSLRAQSEGPGRGATFILELPIASGPTQ